jgi:Mg-chelatase subunit ChlD
MAVALAIAIPCAHADELFSSRGYALTEISHDVAVDVGDGFATFTVTRSFRHPGERSDQAVLYVDLPPGAVATGLRIRTSKRWYDGELMAASIAEQRYEELTGLGVARPMDPALLAWVSEEQLLLQMFPIMPNKRAVVQYELTVPTSYRDGRIELFYPERLPVDRTEQQLLDDELDGDRLVPTKLARPALSIRNKPARGNVVVKTKQLLPDNLRETSWSSVDEEIDTSEFEDEDFEGNPTYTRLSLPAPRAQHAAIRFATHEIDDTSDIVRLEIDVAKQLEAAPKRAHVVFVVDSSRSVGAEGIAGQLEVVRGYMANLPDARFEIVGFDRSAQRVLGRFATRKELASSLAKARRVLVPKNGSNLELGAATAAAALRDVTGNSRVVFLTDSRMRSNFSVSTAVSALTTLRSRPVVHVVDYQRTDAELTEMLGDGLLSSLASRFGGIKLDIEGHGAAGPAWKQIALGLGRPIRIDNFSVAFDDEEFAVPTVLPEGAGVRTMALSDEAPKRIVLTGKIWGRAWRKVVAIDRELQKRLPAIVFGTRLWSEIPEESLPKLAAAGRVVSPVTSYLAIEPGVRPSTDGIERTGFGWGTGVGSFGSGCYGTGIGRLRAETPVDDLFAESVATCAAEHTTEAGGVNLSIEITRGEIVDVAAKLEIGSNEAMQGCVVERIWEVDASERLAHVQAHTFELSLGY